MKQLRIGLPLLALVILMIPAIVLAQDVTEGGVTLLEALGLVHDAYGDEVIIVKASYNDDDACWKFEFEDGTEVCVDEVTGEILVDDSPEITPEPEETPEMEETPEPDDDDMDDVSNDEDEDVDDEDEMDDVDDDDDEDDDDEDVTPTVTMEAAIAIALGIFPDSQVSDVNLDHMHGLLVWDIGLDDNTRAVDIDAMTGAVLFFGFESQDDDSYVSDDDSSDDDHDDDSGDDDHEDDDDHDDDSGDDSSDDSSDDD